MAACQPVARRAGGSARLRDEGGWLGAYGIYPTDKVGLQCIATYLCYYWARWMAPGENFREGRRLWHLEALYNLLQCGSKRGIDRHLLLEMERECALLLGQLYGNALHAASESL